MPDNEQHNPQPDDKKRPLTLGEHLRTEREEKGLTTEDVAQHLLIDTWIVEALEANNFSALGAPVFAKGHLRKYAAMLGLPADELMMEYYQAQDKPDQPPLVARYRSFTKARRSWPWLVIALILFAAAGVIVGRWIIQQGALTRLLEERSATTEEAPVERTVRLAVPEPTGIDNAMPEPVVEEAPVLEIQEPASTESPVSGTEPLEEAESVPVPEATVEAERVQIRLTFNRESWAEIYDANRTRLMYGMGRANSVRVLSGEPPVQVFLGFADGVTVELDGRPYEISAEDRRGNTARFRLEAPGPRQ